MKEVVFLVAFAAAVVTSFFVRPDIRSIDLDVILALFTLMLISKGFEQLKVYDFLALKVIGLAGRETSMAFLMSGFTALISMFVTNDVALLTVVPITLMIGKRCDLDPYRIVTFEILAANIGSSLTPFGNPQNIYIYNCLSPGFAQFVQTSAIFVVPGMILLSLSSLFLSKKRYQLSQDDFHLENRKEIAAMAMLFGAAMIGALGVFEIWIVALIASVYFLVFYRHQLLRIDYFLLLTFVAFFIFVDNLSRIGNISSTIGTLMSGSSRVFAVSALLSQIISNVPAAIILGPFAEDFRPLLLGVSVGGMGTLVASLANLIAFRLYSAQYPSGKFLRFFHIMNFGFLLIFSTAFIKFFA
ncbi:MAG: SLC13 family permease [Saccharofermentanales bacterium]